MWPRIHINTKYLTLNANTMSCVQMLWLVTLWVVNGCQLFTFRYDYNQDSNHLIKGVKTVHKYSKEYLSKENLIICDLIQLILNRSIYGHVFVLETMARNTI
jgi:hypothetical protein